jgi:hypothetical protein
MHTHAARNLENLCDIHIEKAAFKLAQRTNIQIVASPPAPNIARK